MSIEICRLKNKLKVIRPLLQKDKIKLDDMKLEMQHKVDLLEKAIEKHESVSAQREAALATIQLNLGSDTEISVGNLNNGRHYLNELENTLQEATADIEIKKHAIDILRDEMLSQQLGINKLEKYRDRKDQSLFVEIEKDKMHKIDELWMQKVTIEKCHE